MLNVAERIKYLCEKKNISSMYELSKLSHVPQSTLATIMTGSSPRANTLERICEGLGITIQEFFAEEPDALQEFKKGKMPQDLRKIIEREDYTLNGRVATQEDRERLIAMYEALYWDAKQQNKKKK